MIQRLKPWRKFALASGFTSAVLGSLAIGLPASAQSVPSPMPMSPTPMNNRPISPVNSQAYPANFCPSVFLEPRFNQGGRLSSLYCPGYNAITPPLPEARQNPSAVVVPVNGQVTVRLMNQTGDPVTYQVIGDTNQRSLAANSTSALSQLPTPVTITFQRSSDGGLMRVVTRSMQPGMLDVMLYPTTSLGTDRNAMRIQESGEVFLN